METERISGTKGLRIGDFQSGSVVLGDGSRDTVMIYNAEIGDTFTATYTIDNTSHVIKFTVGADTTAKFTNTTDSCIWR